MLEARDLHAGYGNIPILNAVSFTVSAQESVGILGHNGMGKTTLMRVLMGFIPARAGAVLLNGAEVTSQPVHRRAQQRVGYVPQGRQIFAQLSVLDNLRVAALQARQPVDEVIEEFPMLKRLLGRPGGALSGGEQQMLAIARCMCTRPRLILLDEPTEGIQPSMVEQLAEKLCQLRARREFAVICVEQNLEFIAAVSQRVLVIQKGRIVSELKGESVRIASTIADIFGTGVER